MKVFSLLFLTYALLSANALHLSNIGRTLSSEAPLIPTVKLISSFQSHNLRMAQMKAKYTLPPASGSASAAVNGAAGNNQRAGSSTSFISIFLGFLIVFLLF
jgi:hypothetical protein